MLCSLSVWFIELIKLLVCLLTQLIYTCYRLRKIVDILRNVSILISKFEASSHPFDKKSIKRKIPVKRSPLKITFRFHRNRVINTLVFCLVSLSTRDNQKVQFQLEAKIALSLNCQASAASSFDLPPGRRSSCSFN